MRAPRFAFFSGFPSVSEKDGPQMKTGAYAVTENYADYLGAILDVQEHAGQQASLEASLQITADAIHLNLLDFLR